MVGALVVGAGGVVVGAGAVVVGAVGACVGLFATNMKGDASRLLQNLFWLKQWYFYFKYFKMYCRNNVSFESNFLFDF